MTGGQIWERTKPPFLSILKPPATLSRGIYESLSVVHSLSCPVPSPLELINRPEWSMTCRLNSEQLLKYSGRRGHNLAVWFAPHSQCACRCRLDDQEVRQHTFWTNLPWPVLGYLFSKDVFKGVVDQSMGYVNTSIFYYSDCEFERTTCCFDVCRQSGRLLLHVAVVSWAGGAGVTDLVIHRAGSPDCQSRLPGQGCCAGDDFCAGYLQIQVYLPGCPLCWNKRIINCL